MGDIYLDDLLCEGTEPSLFECPTRSDGLHDCDHSEDAGVRCEGIYTIESMGIHLLHLTINDDITSCGSCYGTALLSDISLMINHDTLFKLPIFMRVF